MDGLRLDERLRQASLHYESKQGKDSHVVPVPALDWLDPSVIDWTTLCSVTSKPQVRQSYPMITSAAIAGHMSFRINVCHGTHCAPPARPLQHSVRVRSGPNSRTSWSPLAVTCKCMLCASAAKTNTHTILPV
jgi:hypothetical protein